MGKRLNSILSRAEKGDVLSSDEILYILGLRQPRQLEAVFETARALRRKFFGNRVLLYGFLYISTYCRNNCTFCFYRESNHSSHRYRKTGPEILEAAIQLARSGVHLIDLTMGEDPRLFNDGEEGIEQLTGLIETIKAEVQLPVMVSPGVVPGLVLEKLAKAGADWYACYQETHNRELFKQLRPGQDYDARIQIKKQAIQYGLKVEEGILVGVGEKPEDIVETIETVRNMEIHQVRAMNFVPRENTPMEKVHPPDPLKELLIIALFRLVFPAKCIPATLDVEGLGGLKRRLQAGANVVTSIVPPGQGLAGVARSYLDIDDARRTVSSVLPVLAECGLEPEVQQR